MNDLMKVSSNPHIRSGLHTSHIMLAVIISLLPATGFGIYQFGINALVLIAVSVATTVLTELLFTRLMKKPVTVGDYSAVVTGLLLALNLPPAAPWWIAAVGGIFAILVIKMLFGGLGQNFMNPALAARCFLLIAYTPIMCNFDTDVFTGATPLAALKNGETVNVLNMITGHVAGTIGETSMIAIVAGACLLLLLGVIDLRVPGTYIVSFAVFLVVFSDTANPAFVTAHLSGGGLMLGAFFMATDYVSRPITKQGQYLYGILLGLVTAIFRVFGASAEGVSYAIIIGNLFVPLIEKITVPKYFGYRKQKNS